MRRPAALVLAALVLLAACTAPAQDLVGVEPTLVHSGPYTFAVQIRDGQAEATRTGEPRPTDVAALLPHALHAIEVASSCRVVPTTIRGDTTRLRAPLMCLRL